MSKKHLGSKKKKAHNPQGLIAGYPYCVKCGVIYLKNEATRKDVQGGCPGSEDN